MNNCRHHEYPRGLLCIIVTAILGISPFQSTFAASGTWTGATNKTWQTSSNWNTSPFPGTTSGFSSTDIATFSTAGSGIIDLGGTLNVQSIRIGANGGSAGVLTIGDAGDTLNLTSGGDITVGAGVASNEIIGTAGGGSIKLSTAANSTYSINNNGTGNLTIAAPVTSSQTTGNVSVLTLGGAGNGSATGVLSGTGTAGNAGLGLVKNGSGTWTLSGANTFTGATAINGGTLVLDYATNDPVSTASVTVSGGALGIKGKSVGTTTETLSSLALGSTVGSVSKLTLDANGGSGVGLTIGTFNAGTSGSIVNLIDLSSSSSNSITMSALGGSAAVANGVLMTGATFGNRTATIVVRDSTGYGFAKLSGASSGTLGRLTTGITLTASNSDTNTNARLTAAGTLTRTANLSYNTLTIDSTAGAITLDMGAFNFATAQGRAILISGANNVTISGTGNLGTTVLFSNYSSGTLSVSLAGSTSGLLFGGTGFTNYSGSISGASIVFTAGGGIVRLSKDQSLPNLSSGYHVSGDGVLEIGADLNGATAGDFSQVIGTAAGNIRFTGDSGLSAAGTDRVVNFGGSSTALTWGSTAFLTDLGGVTDGGYTLKLSSAKSDAKVTIQNPIALGTGTSRVIDVANGNAATDAALSGVLSGSGATLVKQGAGTLELSAANTYTGGTVVSSGSLLVNGSLSGTTAVRVDAGAELNVTGSVNSAAMINLTGTLSGAGTVGPVSILSEGILSPGNSGPGTLSAGSTTLAGAATYNVAVKKNATGTAGVDWDKLAVNGTLNLTSVGTGQFTLTLQTYPGDATTFDPNSDKVWPSIITTTGGITGFSESKFAVSATALGSPSGLFTVMQHAGNANNLDLVYFSLPPGAAALGYTTCVIDEQPVAEDIAPLPNSTGNYKWFRGACWSSTAPAADRFTTTNGVLTLKRDAAGGGSLVGAPHNFSDGALPTLPGEDGFYIEFDVRLSDNNSDHFPAVWLMPVEHNGGNGLPVEDIYPGDSAGCERWMELDVDEGGFRPGSLASVIAWNGTYNLSGSGKVFFEEFTNTLASGNMYLSNFEWRGYRDATAANLSTTHAFIPQDMGNPNTKKGYLCLEPGAAGTFAVVRTLYNIFDAATYTFTWSMGNTATTSTVRLLVKVGDLWYASNEEFKNTSTYTAATFASTTAADVQRTLVFSTAAVKWRSFTLNPGTTMTLGPVLTANLPSSKIREIGFYVTTQAGVPVVRLDSLKMTYTLAGSNGYQRAIYNSWNQGAVALDRTQIHTFGASYDPIQSRVTWWLDGVQYFTADETRVPAIAAIQNFYPILSNQTHSQYPSPGVPYDMYVSGVRAYVPPAREPLVAGVTLGTVSNAYTRWQGASITVGSSNITVTELGRMMAPGNTGSHTIKLVNAATGQDIVGGSVSINLTYWRATQFKYGRLATPVVLQAGQTYYVVCNETAGGNSWYNEQTPVTTTSAAVSAIRPVSGSGGSWTVISTPGKEFGPVDIKYLAP
ncbi:MAG: autotransporter-associated beta strand repeat-containing protein [Opitutaceae bacterium]|jgi:autotransporter-associated beta strand protein